MKRFLQIAAFLATLFLDVAGDSDGGQDDEQQQQEPPDDFDDRLALYGRFRGWRDEVDAIEEDGYASIATKLAEDDRDSPEAAALLEELNQREETARKADEEAAARRLTEDDEALREAIRQERADAKAQANREAQEADRRARIVAEIEAEERAAGGPDVREDDPVAAFSRASEALATAREAHRRNPSDPGARQVFEDAAELAVKAARELERGPGFAPNRDALKAGIEAQLARLKEEGR